MNAQTVSGVFIYTIKRVRKSNFKSLYCLQLNSVESGVASFECFRYADR